MAVLSLLAAGGCTLVDQRTFNPEAGRAPPAALPPSLPPAPAPAPSGPQPLVAIPLDPPVAYDGPLHEAVALALRRGRRDFEVRTAVPAGGTSDDATNASTRVAARIAGLIERQGGRTVLTAEADAGRTGNAVLVFVR